MRWGPDKVVQRVLRHSKAHVTKERYIKVFDRTVVEAVEKIQARIEELRQAKGSRQQLELEFGDDFGPTHDCRSQSISFRGCLCVCTTRRYQRTYACHMRERFK